jgi:adenylate kinase family enzyme
MNLQEDINRIKEVMGINENRNTFFIRRQDEFLEDVLNSFDWVEAEESDSFEEYIEDILRHSIDSFFGYNNILMTNEEISELLPVALKILRNNREGLFKEMKGYWYRHQSSRIDESDYALPIKRRLGRLIKHIRSEYGDLAASRFKNFDEFLTRVAFDTTRAIAMNLFDSEDFDDMAKMMDDFEPKVLNYIKTNKEMYDEIHNYFFSEGGWGDPNESSFEKVNRLNESNEINRVKRRMDALLDYIEHSYDWLSPRAFTDFDDFLKRVVFSAARDFVVDEIGGKYKDQLKIREELEPMILELIKRHSIYDEIYDHYISNI